MIRYGISQFVGSWVAASGYRLQIRRVRDDQASVDLLDCSRNPVSRPYMGGALSVKMIAHYRDYEGEFEVELWKRGKGFILHLDCDYESCARGGEAMVPSISRFEQDQFLDEFYPLFGPLDRFVREVNAEPGASGNRRPASRH